MFSRTVALIGDNALQKLKNSRVAVFGCGGVGGFVIEALCRSGVGELDIFDNDKISKSNLNRQIIATVNSVGESKVETFKQRILSINPDIKVNVHEMFYLPQNADSIDLSQYDYIVDAIDTVSAKIELITRAKNLNVPIISCMGTGGKLDPEKVTLAKIENTTNCRLARVIRRELKARNISGVDVVYSTELRDSYGQTETIKDGTRHAPSSMIFVPAVAGIMIANKLVKDICKIK